MKIQEGQLVPKGYGFAWRNYNTMTSEAYIIPLNFIARWFRDFYLLLFRGIAEGKLEDVYHKGFEEGEKCGQAKAEYQIRQLSSQLDVIQTLIKKINH